LGRGPHIGSHPNVPWCCAIVVHKECNDHSPNMKQKIQDKRKT